MHHPDAFHVWIGNSETKFEVYTPHRTDLRESRIYTLWGYRHPVPGLERLAELDRELILLRPRKPGKNSVSDWITFAAGDVNFFRKAYEFVDLEISLDDIPLVEMNEDPDEATLPLELAIVKKPKVGPNRIWQVDKQIDSQRRVLQDLEQQRSRLASDEPEEVYFAYRFDQTSEDEARLGLCS